MPHSEYECKIPCVECSHDDCERKPRKPKYTLRGYAPNVKYFTR